MSADNYINSSNINKIIEENLNYSHTSWLNNATIKNIISNNLNDKITYPSKTSTYAYGKHYDNYYAGSYGDDDSYNNSGSGGYYDDYGDGYSSRSDKGDQPYCGICFQRQWRSENPTDYGNGECMVLQCAAVLCLCSTISLGIDRPLDSHDRG